MVSAIPSGHLANQRSGQFKARTQAMVILPRGQSFNPMRPTHPDILGTRRIIGADEFCRASPSSRFRQQTVVLNFNRRPHLRPRLVPDAKEATLPTQPSERRVAFQKKIIERSAVTWLECAVLGEVSSIGKFAVQLRRNHAALQSASLMVMPVIDVTEAIR